MAACRTGGIRLSCIATKTEVRPCYSFFVRRLIDWLGKHLAVRTVGDRIAEALREIALLWFVFANLDIIVQTSHFSWAWSVKNTVGTVIVWTFAVVFEAAIEKKGANR